VIHAHGQKGSNQKSAISKAGATSIFIGGPRPARRHPIAIGYVGNKTVVPFGIP
jgi:hypothetical protein